MRDVIALGIFLPGAALISWAVWLALDRKRWLRRSALAASRMAAAGEVLAESMDARSILRRRKDEKTYKGRAALFLAKDILWIELDTKAGGAPVELSAIIRTALVPSFQKLKPSAGKHLLYIGWKQDPDGVVEAAFDLPGAGLWKRDLDEVLGHGLQ